MSAGATVQCPLPTPLAAPPGQVRPTLEPAHCLFETHCSRVYRHPDHPEYLVKILKGTTSRTREILCQEEVARASAACVPLLKHFATPSGYALILPHCGQDLLETLSRRGRFSTVQTLWMIDQVAGALAAMHRCEWAHRDVSLENIFFDRTDFWLGDFGLAVRTTLPRHEWRGKHRYRAPESLWCDDADLEAADVWALGVCAFTVHQGHYYDPGFGTSLAPTGELAPLLEGMLAFEVAKRWPLVRVQRECRRLLARERAQLAK